MSSLYGETPTSQRSQRRQACEKPDSCLGRTGEPIDNCNDAPPYYDYALPASEDICSRRVVEAKPTPADDYKRIFMETCQSLDEVLATQPSRDHVDERFRGISQRIDRLIYPAQHDIGKNGRLPFYINSRLLDAGLGLYYHRAVRPHEPFSREVMEQTQRGYVKILREFQQGRYDKQLSIVAHNKIEVESAALLGRALDPRSFPLVALFREEASDTRGYNLDLLTFHPEEGKTPIQIKSSDYRYRSGRPLQEEYSPETALIIHSDVVNLGAVEEQEIKQEFMPVQRPNEEVHIPYETYDPDARFGIRWFIETPDGDDEQDIMEPLVRWFIETPDGDDEQDIMEPLVFTQRIGGKRDGLSELIVAEADGANLSLGDKNLLNAASHYLLASLQEVRRHRRLRHI